MIKDCPKCGGADLFCKKCDGIGQIKVEEEQPQPKRLKKSADPYDSFWKTSGMPTGGKSFNDLKKDGK